MDYSVVIPVHNEQDCVAALCQAVTAAMEPLGSSYELLVVDDASTDETLGKLKSLTRALPLTIVSLRARGGQSAALQAGFDLAQGEILITLDGDFQNDPADIPALLRKLDEGYDMVCGWRRKRNDPWVKKAASASAKALRGLVMRDVVHDVGCSLMVCRRRVLQEIRLSRGLHRFVAWLVAQRGFRVGEVEVHHHPRAAGVSKYGVWDRLIQGSVDLWRLKTGGMERLMRQPPAYEIKEVIRR